MQSYALTVDKFLDHAAKWHGAVEVVTGDAGQVAGRIGYAELRLRANRLSGALLALGLELGDRVGTLAWNTQHHIEVYYAAMGAGLVCHTLNPRLTAAHLAAMINEAEDRVLAVAANLLPMLDELLTLCPRLEHIILLDRPRAPTASAGTHPARFWELEALAASRGGPATWGDFDENSPAGLCYTSGTTGKPKGVLYTHRSNYLHTLRALQADSMAATAADTILVAVPMFHANGWGMPFVGPAAGAKLVLPGRQTDGKSLTMLMKDEAVTIAAGVQTVWLGVLDHLDASDGELPDLKRILIGGSTCPDALIQRMERRMGVEVQTSWGMTELSPLGTIASPGAASIQTRASGRPVMGLDLKLTDAEGKTLPAQRDVVGHLKVKGAAVVDRYFKAESNALDEEGYFDTGDLARIDVDGNLTIAGRSKDLIKSGGEWINPGEIEDIIGRLPEVALVAVIGRPHPRWDERPVLIVEATRGADLDPDQLLQSLRGAVPDWWLPEEVIKIEHMPLAATGKIDKASLRADYARTSA